jgi:hypothetical protein
VEDIYTVDMTLLKSLVRVLMLVPEKILLKLGEGPSLRIGIIIFLLHRLLHLHMAHDRTRRLETTAIKVRLTFKGVVLPVKVRMTSGI